MARPSTAARRFAEAAFSVAERDGAFATWRGELDALSAATADDRLMGALANPATPLEARERLLGIVLGKLPGGAAASRPVANLVTLLLRRGRIDLLPNVAAEFRRLDDARQGIVAASATSASPRIIAKLSDEEK